MRPMSRPLVVLVIAFAFTPVPTLGFEPHADCTFSPVGLPLVRDCGDEGRDVLWYKNRVAGVNRALDALQGPMAEVNPERAGEVLEAAQSMASAMQSTTTQCIQNTCRAVIGRVLGHAQLGWDLGSLFGNAYADQRLIDDWRNKLAAFKDGLAGANERLDACLAAQQTEATARDDAEALNEVGAPKYPADHPLCNPPKEDGSSVTTGGDEGTGKIVDDQRGGASDGGSGAAGSGRTVGGATPPERGRIESFDRAEVAGGVDWMSQELTTCEEMGGSDRRGCVYNVLQYHGEFRNRIGRGINGNANNVEERAPWMDLGSRLQALRTRANEIR